MKSPAKIVIASRESKLAMVQTGMIRERLLGLHPGLVVDVLGMTTQGDQILDRPLAQIGGKGLFIKELEEALADGRADLAVHSLKDVPMQMPEGFALAAIMEREDPRDALVSPHVRALGALPSGSVVGTSSLRREAQIRYRHPGLAVEPLRGNVGTRLRKLDEGRYAAVVLAVAGLARLGLADRIARALEPEESLPAVGQGALGIECRAERAELVEWLSPLAHPPTSACVRAERAFSAALAGSCHTPLAGYATLRDGTLRLRGLVATRDGTRCLEGERSGAADDPEPLGRALAGDLLARGAGEILAAAAREG